jgi:6-phosphogluconolactonase/glucosamine-6-phosphate isomerase/deaminase
MTLELEVVVSAAEAGERVAALVAERVAAAEGAFALALSKAAPVLLSGLAESLPWEHVAVFQVDERVAPPGTSERNSTALLAALPPIRVRAMPVDDPDLDAAAARYAEQLPPALDLVHLGLGEDGHTASLVPGDPVLDIHDRLVAITGEYQGRRRMTLTYPALEAAREVVWLVTGEEKRDPLGRLLARDPYIPAGRVGARRQLVVADAAAMG